jgi:hypothetical protein
VRARRTPASHPAARPLLRRQARAPAVAPRPPAPSCRSPAPPPRAKDPEAQAQSAVDGGLVKAQFASALASALQRSGGERALLQQAAASVDEERES